METTPLADVVASLDPAEFLTNGGEAGALMREHDWSASPLGEPSTWPQSLRSVVGLLLSSKFPMFVAWGKELGFLYNDAYAEILGAKHPAALGARFQEIWSEIWPDISPLIETALAGQSSYHEDLLLVVNRKGYDEQAWFTFSYSPVRDESGRVAGMFCTVAETTGRVLAERRNASERERLARMFEQAPGFIAILKSPEHVFDFANAAFRHLFGDRDFVGKTARKAFPELEGQGFYELLDQVYTTGERFVARQVPIRLERSPGAPPEELVLDFIYEPVTDEAGQVTGIFVEGHDITEARRTEAALRESEERFRALAEQAVVGVCLTNPDLRFVYANDTYARLVGRSPEEIVGRTVEELTAPEDWPQNRQLLDRMLSEGEPFFIEKRYVRPHRPEVWVRNSVSARRDASGQIAGVIAISLDITKRKQAEAELRESEERLRAILETATDYAIFTTDAEGRIETWPAGAQEVFGWTAAEAIGQPVDMTFTPEDRETATPETERMTARAAGHAPNVRWHLRKDGSRVFIDGVTRPLTGPDGTLEGFLKVGQDVTERRRAEEQLQLATEAAELGIFDVDFTTGSMEWDARQRELWGLGSDEIITDETFLAGIHPEDRERVQAALAQTFTQRTGGLYSAEYRLLPQEHGDECWIAATGRIHFEGERPVRLIGTVQDISERKRTEAALRESEARLRELNQALEQRVREQTAERNRVWEMSRDLFAIMGFDGYLKAVNPAWTDVLGFDEATLLSRDFSQQVHPDDHGAVGALIGRLRSGEAVPHFEDRLRHADGSWRWIAWSLVPEGEVFYAVGRDVTAERERQAQLEAAESARREADALYRAYFQNSAEGLFVVGVQPEGGFSLEEINPTDQAILASIGLELVPGVALKDQLPPELADAITANYRRLLETGEVQRYRESAPAGGQMMHFETVLVPVNDEAGRVTRIMGSTRDMTAQVHAEEALRQSQKMEAMGQLTGGVAHDFNNLLTPIIASLDMLLRRGVGSERERRLMDGALQSAERAKTLVQRLLAFARRQPLQPGPVDVRRLVGNMAELIASTLGPRIDVRVELPEDLPPALADANQLEMAVLNLAVNARDAMSDAGVLTISAARESVRRPHPAKLRHGHYVRLSVKDTGTGMDEATLARAVEPFFSTKGIGKGTGLGLSMVHGLASQLGGGMTIASQLGQGTTVDLWLPISAVAVAEDGPAHNDAVAPKAQGTALLVDDEDLVRLSTADMLLDLGYEVVEAQSAEEALRLIGEGLQPDLVVTDHLMPGLSGLDLARDLRSRQPDLPVLIVSGYAEMDGIALGFPRLTKPFRSGELAASLAALVPTRAV